MIHAQATVVPQYCPSADRLPPIPPLILKSRICFFLVIYDSYYRRFPVPRVAVSGGSTVLTKDVILTTNNLNSGYTIHCGRVDWSQYCNTANITLKTKLRLTGIFTNHRALPILKLQILVFLVKYSSIYRRFSNTAIFCIEGLYNL